jgi:hypothetical protein
VGSGEVKDLSTGGLGGVCRRLGVANWSFVGGESFTVGVPNTNRGNPRIGDGMVYSDLRLLVRGVVFNKIISIFTSAIITVILQVR